MRHPSFYPAIVALAASLFSVPAAAEETVVIAPSPVVVTPSSDEAVVVTSSGNGDELVLRLPAPEEARFKYEDYKLQELQRKAKRSRNALIGTSIAAAVGFALVAPATRQCESIEVNGESDYQCTRAGDALLRAGSPLLVGGLTGALVSGIILGVRKGKIRRLNDSFPTKSRAVRWNGNRLAF